MARMSVIYLRCKNYASHEGRLSRNMPQDRVRSQDLGIVEGNKKKWLRFPVEQFFCNQLRF